MSHANRGAALEQYVDLANAQYWSLGVAQVQKVAVPTRIVHNRRDDVAEVVRSKSTVDFVGAWKGGRAVAFDAKENNEASGFPLKNVKPHQVDFLRLWHRLDGLAFLLILHQPDQAVYLLPGPQLFLYWDAWNAGRSASIPVEELRRLPRVAAGRGCALDYLAAVTTWIHTNGWTVPLKPLS